ncbi:TPA: hypothetical protein ACSTL0_004609 [Serratia fonticola]
MAKKARFYKVIYRTAHQDNVTYFKPVPAPSKAVASAMIGNENVNVINTISLGWHEIWLAPGDYAESNDLAIFGITLNAHEFTYTSVDFGWNYLNNQFQEKVDNFITEYYPEGDY